MADPDLLKSDAMKRRLLLASAGLAFVAGYADTASFVGANGVFCAHVTGNFVVLAADLAGGGHAGDWLKLTTFPLFVFAVALTTRVTRGGSPLPPRTLVWVSVVLLALVAGLAWVASLSGLSSAADPSSAAGLATFVPPAPSTLFESVLVGVMVLAMGVQNAMHRLHPNLGPMTTVMTGNVTGFVSELVHFVRSKGDTSKLKLGGALIVAFTLGCASGAFGTHYFGFASVIVPALVLLGPVRASLPVPSSPAESVR